MSFQVWKNATQLSTVLKKSSPHCVSPSTTSILKPETHQQKRRRNSASERITETSSPDHPKKAKPSKDKITTAMTKKTETSIPPTDDSTSDTSKNDSNNVGSLPTSSEKPANPTEDTSISIKIEVIFIFLFRIFFIFILTLPFLQVKHEVEDIPDLEESIIDETIDDCENTASLSPSPLYENSMLARSLLSGNIMSFIFRALFTTASFHHTSDANRFRESMLCRIIMRYSHTVRIDCVYMDIENTM